jgi:hypothetical protein
VKELRCLIDKVKPGDGMLRIFGHGKQSTNKSRLEQEGPRRASDRNSKKERWDEEDRRQPWTTVEGRDGELVWPVLCLKDEVCEYYTMLPPPLMFFLVSSSAQCANG